MKRATFFTLILGVAFCVSACNNKNADVTAPPVAPDSNSVDYTSSAPGDVATIATEEAFRDFVKNNEIAVVKFGAEWCGPCKALDPEFDKIAGYFQTSGFAFARADADDLNGLAKEIGVGGIPDVRIYYNGQPYNSVVGNYPDVIANALESMRQATKSTTEVADAVKKQNAPLENELWGDENTEEKPEQNGELAAEETASDASVDEVEFDENEVEFDENLPEEEIQDASNTDDEDDFLSGVEPGEVSKLSTLDELNAFFGSHDLVVVKFGATWCPPCRRLDPKLPLLAGRFEDDGVAIVDVDVDEAEELADKFSVNAIPRVIVFYKGVQKGSVVGYAPDEILETIQRVVDDPEAAADDSFDGDEELDVFDDEESEETTESEE